MLSFFSIFGIQNNYFMMASLVPYVVNCFHFSVSLGYKTTTPYLKYSKKLLWIAFIFQYLWDTQQHWLLMKMVQKCCELLSFFSIFGIHNNGIMVANVTQAVVNCFHFSVSLGYTTTSKFNPLFFRGFIIILEFAFLSIS